MAKLWRSASTSACSRRPTKRSTEFSHGSAVTPPCDRSQAKVCAVEPLRKDDLHEAVRLLYVWPDGTTRSIAEFAATDPEEVARLIATALLLIRHAQAEARTEKSVVGLVQCHELLTAVRARVAQIPEDQTEEILTRVDAMFLGTTVNSLHPLFDRRRLIWRLGIAAIVGLTTWYLATT